MLEKNTLRKSIIEYRKGISSEQKSIWDCKITEIALNSSYYKMSDNMLIYVSAPLEVSTKNIILKSLNNNKIVFVPKCDVKTKSMNFYSISSFSDLNKGAYGLLEPKRAGKLYTYDLTGVCFVPALSCDSYGYRLGWGGGFYDKFLSSFLGLKIGLCYSSCFVNKLDHESHDVSLDIAITENDIIYFKK